MWVVRSLTPAGFERALTGDRMDAGILFRSDELSRVSSLLCNGTAEKGAVVWITGAPGSGKSSLVRAAVRSVKAGGPAGRRFHVADGKLSLSHLHAGGGASAKSWRIVSELVRSILEHVEDDITQFVTSVLSPPPPPPSASHQQSHMHLDATYCLQCLVACGVVSCTRISKDIAMMNKLDMAQDLPKMQAAAKHTIAEIIYHASAAGDVFIVDDLDYTDAVSLEILCMVLSRCRTFTAIFTCGSLFLEFAREGLQDEAGRKTRIRGQFEAHIFLDHFTHAEIARVLEYAGLSTENAGEVFKKTGGRQSFVMGVIHGNQAGVRNEDTDPLSLDSDGYSSVEGEIAITRIDNCSGGAKLILQAASIVGLRWSLEIVLQMLSEDNAIFDSYLGNLFIQELMQAHLIVEGNRPGNYEFSHVSLQDKAYALQLHDRREKLHLRCARIMEKDVDAKRDVALSQDIGQHYMKSKEPWRAYSFFLCASQLLNYRGSAPGNVISSFLVNLNTLDKLPSCGMALEDEAWEDRAHLRLLIFQSQIAMSIVSPESIARAFVEDILDFRQQLKSKPASLSISIRYFSFICMVRYASRVPLKKLVGDEAFSTNYEIACKQFYNDFHLDPTLKEEAAAHFLKYYRWHAEGCISSEPVDRMNRIASVQKGMEIIMHHPELDKQLHFLYGHDETWSLLASDYFLRMENNNFIEMLRVSQIWKDRPQATQRMSRIRSSIFVFFFKWWEMDVAALSNWVETELKYDEWGNIALDEQSNSSYRLAAYFNFGKSKQPAKLSREGVIDLGLRDKIRKMFARYQETHVSPSFIFSCPWWQFETQNRNVLEAVVEEIDFDLNRINGESPDAEELRFTHFFPITTGYLLAVKAVALHHLGEQQVFRAGSDVHSLLLRAIEIASAPTASLMVNVHVFVVILRLLNHENTGTANEFVDSFRADVKNRLENTFCRMRAECKGVKAGLEFVDSFQERALSRICNGNDE
jgi:hypothetical protein